MDAGLDAIVVGGGLAGLVCARQLCDAGLSCQLLEASDQVGGRGRTDEVEGFLLDRGFQVFLTAYPEAKTALDYEALDLCPFEPGALIRCDGKFHRLSDPWRRPQHALATALSRSATLRDKLRIASFRRHTTRGELNAVYNRPEQPAIDLLHKRRFSNVIIERFFRPFLGGVFLDPELQTSSRMCEFVFRMFSLGDAAVPAKGMGEIPRQLSHRLPTNVVRTNTRVESCQGQQVLLSSGEQLSAREIIIATEAPIARQMLGDSHPAVGQSVSCLYCAAPQSPVVEPILVLNGDGSGPINNLCVPSQVSPSYAPDGQSLVSVTVLGCLADEQARLDQVHSQLKDWFGPNVESWRHLKSYDIEYALPAQSPPALRPVEKSPQVRQGVFVCGDHCDTGSINGAMAAGRRAAEAAVEVLRKS
ncbi:NAD(P)/FAD-dependent oxidoreductase [Pirellulales bacterium]|nr:NAD(P)/FAD-dependent oxidoreductase [Pirellulales bacterium]